MICVSHKILDYIRVENVGRVKNIGRCQKMLEGCLGQIKGVKTSEDIGNIGRVSGTNKKSKNIGRHWKTLKNIGKHRKKHWKDIGGGRVKSWVKIWYVTLTYLNSSTKILYCMKFQNFLQFQPLILSYLCTTSNFTILQWHGTIKVIVAT